MKGTFHQTGDPALARSFIATVWPRSATTDSELQRRKKAGVRSAQLAVAVMVAAGVVGAIMADFRTASPLRITALILAAVAYTVWSLYGMCEPIRLLLAEPASVSPRPAADVRTVIYFVVQLALASSVFTLSNQIRGGALAWLVLLPPVAHGVILLPRRGVVLVALASTAILAVNVARQQGWPFVLSASIAFSFSVFFTCIFTLLAVSAERSRGEVQKLADELAAANRRLREQAVETEELAATRERNRVAREIHDSLGHYLTVVNVQLEAARAMHSRDAARSRDALDKAQSLTQAGLKEIRRSVASLRAPPLGNKPLATALGQLGEESSAAGLEVELQIIGFARELPPAAELTLYRAAQEGLTNVRKHAGTSRARLTLDFSDAAKVFLRVSDQGTGTTEGGEPKAGFGLLGLRERAHLLGGAVRVTTAPGAGFTLEVEVPA